MRRCVLLTPSEIRVDDPSVAAHGGHRALGQHPTLRQHDNPLAQRRYEVHVVLDDDDGVSAFAIEPLDHLPELHEQGRVDARSRLVEQHEPWLGHHRPAEFQQLLLSPREVTSAEMIREYDVRTPSIFVPISSLSGGNQQKVIVAREFSRPIRLLIAAQPTRGLDVGSIEFIHRQLIRMRDEGVAVMLVSTELDEILSLSDRIAVMYHGEILDVLDIEEATREEIGLLMAGVVETETMPV